MIKKLWLFYTALLGAIPLAQAHPHAFIDMQTKVLVEQDQLKGFSVQWLLDEASSAEMLYDLQLAENREQKHKAMVEDIVKNIIAEHYFSYLYDKQGNKVKYSSKPANYGFRVVNHQIQYYFDFFLSQPKSLKNEQLNLMIYDPSYYVSMYYHKPTAVDFSQLPSQCRGELLQPQVDEKTKQYAAALDKSQKEADFSLGAQFAQKLIVQCQ